MAKHDCIRTAIVVLRFDSWTRVRFLYVRFQVLFVILLNNVFQTFVLSEYNKKNVVYEKQNALFLNVR